MQQITRDFPRGPCSIFCFGPDDPAAPVVLFFGDVFGPRPASFAVAEELAGGSRRVLMPEPFYDQSDYPRFVPEAVFPSGPERDRMMAMVMALTPAGISADAQALLGVAAELSAPDAPIAALGYCMGGRYALYAACASPRVRLAAAMHAGRMAPADGDGPHRQLEQISGRVYVAVAGDDALYTAEEHGRLAQALRAAGCDHTLETYIGAGHGWVFADVPTYNPAAAAKVMRRLNDNFAEVLDRT